MAIFISFDIPPVDVTCVFKGEFDSEGWDIINAAKEDGSLFLMLKHPPSFIGFEVKLRDIYDGNVAVSVKSPGILTITGIAKAKIDGSAKALKEIERDNPSDIRFTGVGALTKDLIYGGMFVVSDEGEIPVSVNLSTKKI